MAWAGLGLAGSGAEDGAILALEKPQRGVKKRRCDFNFTHCQVKSSQVGSGATRPRGDHPDPNLLRRPPLFLTGTPVVKSSQVVGLRDRVANGGANGGLRHSLLLALC